MITRVSLCVNPVVGHMWGMARDDLHFRLRIPEALKAQIEASAKANNRSMTAEIVSRLERSFDLDETTNGLVAQVDELDATTADHDRRIDALEDRVWRLMERAGLYDPNRRD